MKQCEDVTSSSTTKLNSNNIKKLMSRSVVLVAIVKVFFIYGESSCISARGDAKVRIIIN